MKVIKSESLVPFLISRVYDPDDKLALISALTNKPYCLNDIVVPLKSTNGADIKMVMDILNSKRIIFWHNGYESGRTYSIAFENNNGDYINLDINQESAIINIFSNNPSVVEKYEPSINEMIRLLGPDTQGFINVQWLCFLKSSDHDCLRMTMKLHKNFEDGIPMANYAPETREEIMKFEESIINDNYYGQLVVLEGLPGTGKSFYVRRLVSRLYQSKKIKKIHYYLGEGVSALNIASCINPNLLIFEDADHILRMDTERGNDLTKILNFSSGFVDTKALFVFTTNLELKDLDPALTRDGRLLARIRFNTFSRTGAQEWLARNGCELNLDKEEYTLANLYALLRNFKKIGKDTKPANIGFRMPELHSAELVEEMF